MQITSRNTGWRHYALLFLGVAILAFGLFNIHSRTQITEGGVLGATLLLQHWFGISPGISGLLMDATCYLIGLKLLGKAFLKNALFASAGFSLSSNVFERIGYLLPDLTELPLPAALLGGLFVGVGVGIVVREGGASGGDDALAMCIAHVTGMGIQWAYLSTDLVVLGLSLTYIPLRRIGYSLLTVLISGQLIGLVQRLPLPWDKPRPEAAE